MLSFFYDELVCLSIKLNYPWQLIMKDTSCKKAKIGFFITFLLALTFCAEISTAYGDFQRTKIAVLDFELIGDKQETAGLGVIVSEWFITGIVKYGRFDVVERAMLQKILAEQKLSSTGMIDETSAATLGKILGVKVIISGAIVKIRDSIEINSRVINVENGSIIAAESSRGNANTDLHVLVDELLAKILANFPLTGYVVKRNPKTAIIDLGVGSGLTAGTEFYTYKEGEVIKHPKTGEILDVEQIITGKLIITKVSQSIAEGEIQSEESGGIQYGQMVKSVQKEAYKTPSKKPEKSVDKPVVKDNPAHQEAAPPAEIAKKPEKPIEKPIVKSSPAHQEPAPPADTTQKQEKTIQKQTAKDIPAVQKNTVALESPLAPVGQTQEKGKLEKKEASTPLPFQPAIANNKSTQKASPPPESLGPPTPPKPAPASATTEQQPASSSQVNQAATNDRSQRGYNVAIFPFEMSGDATPYSGVLAERISSRIGETPGLTLTKSSYKQKGVEIITGVNARNLFSGSSPDLTLLSKKGVELGINLAILGSMNIHCKDSSMGSNNCDIRNLEVFIINLTTGKVYRHAASTGSRATTEDAIDEACKGVFAKFNADRPR